MSKLSTTRGWDGLLRVAGGLLALVGGFATGALAVLLVPLRLADLAWVGGLISGTGATRVPVAVVIAISGGLFLVWFASRATGSRWGAVLPAVGWFTVVALALRTTDGGDRLLMPDDWVGSLTLFGGTVVLVIGMVTGLTSRSRPATPDSHAPRGVAAGPPPPGPAPPPAGSTPAPPSGLAGPA